MEVAEAKVAGSAAAGLAAGSVAAAAVMEVLGVMAALPAASN